MTAAGAETSVQVELLNETSALLSDTKVALAKLSDVTETAATKGRGRGAGKILP